MDAYSLCIWLVALCIVRVLSLEATTDSVGKMSSQDSMGVCSATEVMAEKEGSAFLEVGSLRKVAQLLDREATVIGTLADTLRLEVPELAAGTPTQPESAIENMVAQLGITPATRPSPLLHQAARVAIQGTPTQSVSQGTTLSELDSSTESTLAGILSSELEHLATTTLYPIQGTPTQSVSQGTTFSEQDRSTQSTLAGISSSELEHLVNTMEAEKGTMQTQMGHLAGTTNSQMEKEALETALKVNRLEAEIERLKVDHSERVTNQKITDQSLEITNLLRVEDPWKKCDKDWLVALLLTIFLFAFGAGRFYMNHMTMGAIQLCGTLLLCMVQAHSQYMLKQVDTKEGEAEDKKAEADRNVFSSEQAFRNGVRFLYFLWQATEIVLLCTGRILPTC